MSAQAAENKNEKHYLTIVAGIVIALIFLFYMFTFSVPIGRLAVKTEFGKPKTPITRPGLYFKIPVVNNVRPFDAKIQVSEDRFEETMTRDQQTVIIMAYILWRIDEPLKFLNAVGTLEEGEDFLKQLVRVKKNAVFGNHDLSELVSTDPDKLKYDETEEEILNAVNGLARENYGIAVKQIGIKRLSLPEGITRSVFERMMAERKKFADDLRSKGEGEAAGIMARTNRDVEHILSRSQALALKSYEVFAENPELSNFLKKIDALKEAFKERATLILYGDAPPFDLLNKEPKISGPEPETSE